MARVEIVNITKLFDENKALDDVTLDVKDRSFTCILGPPGAGKTTLFRLIAGLEPPDSGRIYIDGQDVTDIPPQRRGVSMVFQVFALYPQMTVYNNISSPLRTRKLSKDEIDKKVKGVSEFLGISDLLDRKPKELSGGESQRVAIARAIVRESKVLLLDEPLTNVDYKIREDMRSEFKRMKKELGQTIIYATPDPVDALAMADYVAIIRDGRIEQYGQTNELYRHPLNVFSATYFGYPEMNVMECSLIEKNGELLLDIGPFTVDVTALRNKLAQAGNELILGVRPEHLYVNEEKPVKRDVVFKATVLMGEVIGSDTILHIKVADYLLKALIPKIYRPEMGASINISFNLDKLHIFDKRSGKVII